MVLHESGRVVEVMPCGVGHEGVEVYRCASCGADYVEGPHRRLVPRSMLVCVVGQRVGDRADEVE